MYSINLESLNKGNDLLQIIPNKEKFALLQIDIKIVRNLC